MSENAYFIIADRKKDMIKVSGFNVNPNKIEEIISSHPKVSEAGVMSVADEHSGEAVKAFIVRKDPSLSEEDIIQHCRENLTGYKRPKYILFRDELPKYPVGKILRKDLLDIDG